MLFKKKRNLVIIRVDGNHMLGLGHVVRELNLARQLKKVLDANITFLFRDNSIVSSLLKNHGFQVIPLGNKESFKQELRRYRDAALVIVDTPLFLSRQLNAIKKYTKKLVHITDARCASGSSDLTIMPNLIGSRVREIRSKKIFTGKQYIMLNEKFVDYRKKYKACRDVRNIVICFGGSDPKDITKRIVNFLHKNSKSFFSPKITVIIGPAYRNTKNLIGSFGNNIKFRFKQATCNIARELFNADIAIVSGGTLMYEASAIGVPSLIICQNRAQMKEADFFHKQGALINLGLSNTLSKTFFLQQLNDIATNALSRKKLSTIARKSIDPYGIRRITKTIYKLITMQH